MPLSHSVICSNSAPKGWYLLYLTEESGKQRHQSNTDESDTAASHQLLHALGLGTGVIVAVAFEQVDRTPDTKTGTESDDERLQYTDCTVEKCQRLFPPFGFRITRVIGLIETKKALLPQLMCTYAAGKGYEKSRELIRVSASGYVLVSI